MQDTCCVITLVLEFTSFNKLYIEDKDPVSKATAFWELLYCGLNLTDGDQIYLESDKMLFALFFSGRIHYFQG